MTPDPLDGARPSAVFVTAIYEAGYAS